jgi:hypothetical protein
MKVILYDFVINSFHFSSLAFEFFLDKFSSSTISLITASVDYPLSSSSTSTYKHFSGFFDFFGDSLFIGDSVSIANFG